MTAESHLLGPFVRRFLVEEVVADRNLCRNTQLSYRDAIRLFFGFLAQRHATAPARVTVEQVTAKVARAFLDHLQEERANTPATRNQRLAALHALFRFISRQAPELVEHAATIQAIPPKRTAPPTMPYLDKHEMDALLAAPNRQRPQGRRDYALLLFLYNTGARASETATLTIEDLALDAAPSVRLCGKGRKTRLCPLWPHTAEVLREILARRSDQPKSAPVFLNVRGQPITRYGIHALVARSAQKAAKTTPSLRAKRVSPHTLRHTTAVHLLRAGVDINTIRAWLGHASLETTNRYAQIDLERKAAALATCAVSGLDADNLSRTPIWRHDRGLMAFLTNL